MTGLRGAGVNPNSSVRENAKVMCFGPCPIR
jgi:hypothetical protein